MGYTARLRQRQLRCRLTLAKPMLSVAAETKKPRNKVMRPKSEFIEVALIAPSVAPAYARGYPNAA